MQDQFKKHKKAVNIVLWAVGVTALAAAIFFAGFFTYRLTLPGGLLSLLWFKSQIDDKYIEDISDEDFWQAAIDGVEDILDDYSRYYTREDFEAMTEENAGVRADVGLSYFSATNKIVRVAVGSPLFATGEAESGMYLTGVGDGRDSLQNTFDAASLDEALAAYGDGDSVCLRFSDVSASDTEHCTYATVTVGEYMESFVVYAAQGRAYAVLREGEGDAGEWTDIGAYTDLDERFTGSTAYIRIVRFRGDADDDFARAMRQYREDGADTLLLDLRNNGGGDVSIMQNIAAYLLRDAEEDRPVVMTAEYKDGSQQVYRAAGNYYGDYLAGSEVYAVANHNSASASEALLGAMISYGTIGYGDIFLTDTTGMGIASTYGKGIMQVSYYDLLTGDGVTLTTARCNWPNGTCIHGTGIRSQEGTRLSPAQTFADPGDAELDYIIGQIG